MPHTANWHESMPVLPSLPPFPPSSVSRFGPHLCLELQLLGFLLAISTHSVDFCFGSCCLAFLSWRTQGLGCLFYRGNPSLFIASFLAVPWFHSYPSSWAKKATFPSPLSAWSVTQLTGGPASSPRTQHGSELGWPGECVLGGEFNPGWLLLTSAQSVEELRVWKRSLEREKPEWADFSCWFKAP